MMKASCAFQLLYIDTTWSIIPQEYSMYTMTLEYFTFVTLQ